MEIDKRFEGSKFTDADIVSSLLFEAGASEEVRNSVLRFNGVSEKAILDRTGVETVCKMEGHWFDPEHDHCARCGFPKALMEELS